jgi:hypothetical protein
MAMYPPVVSVAGFANVDRGMFRAVSNLTKELECCKKQIYLILLRNSFKINLQILCRKISASSTDILVYCTGTFIHISVRVLLLMDGQKLGVLETSGVLLHRVPIYEKKHNIYAHSIFCYELALMTKIINTIDMLPFGTKCITLKITITIKTFPLFP